MQENLSVAKCPPEGRKVDLSGLYYVWNQCKIPSDLSETVRYNFYHVNQVETLTRKTSYLIIVVKIALNMAQIEYYM